MLVGKGANGSLTMILYWLSSTTVNHIFCWKSYHKYSKLPWHSLIGLCGAAKKKGFRKKEKVSTSA